MKSKRSPWQVAGVLLIVLLVLCLITGGVGVSMYNAENPPVAQQPYYRQVGWNNDRIPSPGGDGVGFPRPSVEAEVAEAQNVRKFFAGFAAALKQKNAAPEPWLDTVALRINAGNSAPPGLTYPNYQGDGGILPQAEGESRALTHVLRTSRAAWRSWNWDSFTVHRVNEVGFNSYHAYTSVTKPDGSRIKIRWMLTRRAPGESYAITNWTDLATGIGSDFDIALSMISHSTGAGLDRLLLNLRSLHDAHRAMDEDKFEDARKHLDAAARARPTGDFATPYELAEARYDLLSGDSEVSAMDRLDALLLREHSNLTALMLQMRAVARDGRYEEMADLAHRYQAVAGPDADALAWTGVAEAAQERPDEARALFEQALKLDPNQVTAIVGLLKLTPDSEKSAFVDRLGQLVTFYIALFHRLVDRGQLYGEWKTVELLARTHRRGLPGDHTAARHLVRALMMQDRFAAATEVFRESIGEIVNEQRERLLNEFLDSSAAKNKQREAYDAVPAGDRAEAFRSVMQSWDYRLFDSDDFTPEQDAIREKYAALLEVHGKTRPDDDWVLIHRAKELNRSGDRTAAEKSARTVLDRVKPADDIPKDNRSGFADARREWLMAKLHLGQSVAAYERFPNEATFNELAGECAVAKNPDELDRLLAAREKREPDFAARRYWRGESFWIKESYRRCAEEMKAYLAEIADGDGYHPFEYTARERLIRSWVKAKNAEAALEYLAAEERPPPLLQALALAAGKSGEEAEVFLIDSMTANAWLATMAYRDPDLGPLLLGPAFKRLREKHPPPPEKKKPVG